MSTLLLRLAAPLQSWGVDSKFDRRMTNTEPTRSGVIGLLAAAMGVQRSDSLAPFLPLKFGVRIDQPGKIQRDFQMAHMFDDDASWLTDRYYIEDAVFLAAVEGEDRFLSTLEQALQHPMYPLFLGRRSCPPAGPLVLGIRDKDLRATLLEEKWQAAPWYQKKSLHRGIKTLDIVRDAGPEEVGYVVRDLPQSFDQHRRLYQFRNVVREQLLLENILKDDSSTGTSNEPVATEHDPMDLLGEYDVSIKSQD